MNFNHLDDTIRLVFRKTMLSAEKQIWGKQVPETGKLVRRPLERGIWVRTMWFGSRLWLLFKDGRGVGIWGSVGYGRRESERGIKVNMKVSDWDGWVVAGT